MPVRPTKQYMAQLARWHGEGKLKPHVSPLPLAKAAEALKLMATRQVKGKLVPTSG